MYVILLKILTNLPWCERRRWKGYVHSPGVGRNHDPFPLGKYLRFCYYEKEDDGGEVSPLLGGRSRSALLGHALASVTLVGKKDGTQEGRHMPKPPLLFCSVMCGGSFPLGRHTRRNHVFLSH